jgi:phytoene dehydrogenase-like protein
MKAAFDETYRSLGPDIDQRLNFTRLDPNYRVYFHDQSHVDLFSDMPKLAAEVETVEAGAGKSLERFMAAGERKYSLGMDFVDRNYDHITDLMNPMAGIRLLQTRSYERLYHQVSQFFHSDKLQKAFTFHSMFWGFPLSTRWRCIA